MNAPTARLHLVRLDGFRQRLQGLIGRRAPSVGQGVLLPRCSAVHTAFMGYAIDVVFLDANGRVLRLVQQLQPWRMAWCGGASLVLEMRAGSAPPEAELQAMVWQALANMPSLPA